MNKQQIEHMVSRFLSWTLPADFSPDGGASYTPLASVIPTGTNLLNYPQARAMVLHMLTGLPEGDPEWEGELTAEETAKIDAAWEQSKMTKVDDVPRALAEQACVISLAGRCIRIECDKRKEAIELLDWLCAHEPAPVDPLYAASAHMRMEFMSSPTVWTDDDWYGVLREALELHAPVRARSVTLDSKGEG